MSHLIRASSVGPFAMVRGLFRRLRDVQCTQACQVDRELMSLRTVLTQQSGWSAAGMQ
ncbi:MAG: hypothetical protein QM747_12955 [Nocardioides sp.]